MEGGPPSFTPDFSCRALLRNSTTERSAFAYGPLTRCGIPFQGTSASLALGVRGSYNPAPTKEDGLGSAPFARHY